MTVAARSALMAILLVGAYVRLSHPDLTWFSGDQARDAHTALAIVSGDAFPLLGVEVAGGPAHTWGPVYFYLLAPLFAVSRDPALAVAVLAVTSVVAVFVTYRLGLTFFGRAVGLLSAAVLATYPIAVVEAKALWNVAPVALGTVLFFHALLSLVVHERSIMIVPALAALGVLVQLHLSALSLGVVLVVAVALFRPRVRAVHLAIGCGVLMALMLPYLAAQASSAFADLRAGGAVATQLRLRTPAELGALARGVLFASPDLMAGIRGLQDPRLAGLGLLLHRLESWVFVVGLAFVALSVALRLLRKAPRDATFRAAVVVALGFAVPFALLGSRGSTQPHYFDVAFPMPIIAGTLLLAWGIDVFGAIAGVAARRALWTGVAVVVVATALTQIDFHRQLWRRFSTTGGTALTPNGLELMPIRYKARLARILVNDFGADSSEVFRRLHGSRARDWLEDGGYFFESAARGRRPGSSTAPDRARHYAVVLDEATGERLHGTRLVRRGPYAVVEYTPWIDYSTWQCADGGHGAATDWVVVALPTARLPEDTAYGIDPHRAWRSPTVACRGRMDASAPRSPRVHVVVSLRTFGRQAMSVDPLRMNGRPIAASRILAHSTFGGHTIDAIFDVTEHLRDGPNELHALIAGDTTRFDLDVFELRG